jgi:hypothetical protein
LKRRSVTLLCSGFFVVGFVFGLLFVGFASVLVPGTHATGYNQSIHTDLLPILAPTPCSTLTLSPTPSPTPIPTVGTTPAPPELRVEPTSLSFSVPPGTSSTQLIRITNIGGGQLDWMATLGNGTPSYISISPSSVSGLAGGASVFMTVTVDATHLAGGAFTTSVTITAIDPITNQSVAGSPSVVNIHLSITSRSLPSPTPSLSPTPCLIPSPALSPSPTFLPTPSPTPCQALALAASPTPVFTPSPSPSPTPVFTPTPSPSPSPTPCLSPTPTPTPENGLG